MLFYKKLRLFFMLEGVQNQLNNGKKSAKYKKILGGVAFGVITIFILGFLFKVFHYYRQIQSGQFSASDLTFKNTRVTSKTLEAFADAAPGSGVLASVDDPSLGPDNAQLTIVEFADFGCPYSKEESYVITALAKQYPTVKFIYRDFPLDDIHPGANLAAQAGECAHEQGAFWEYHDLLYRHSGEFTTTALIDYAEQLDLNTAQFTECLTSGAYRDEVLNDARDGVSAGVEGTPTLFFNGQKISGAIPYQTFVDLIEAFTKTDPEINQ